MTQHSAYIWHPLHCRWQRTHSITPNHSIYDVTSTLARTAQRLLQTWYHTPSMKHGTNCIFVITTSPLISHPLLYDITFTICVTSYALYITSYPLLLSSQNWTYDSTTLTYETTSSMQLKVYTVHVTSVSLVLVITPTVLRASHPLFLWHHTRHRYYIFCTIENITSPIYEI